MASGAIELWPRDWWEFSDPVFVGASAAYAVWTGIDSKVMRLDAGEWLPIVSPLPYDLPYQLLWHLWSDGDVLWIAGDRGSVLSLEDGGWRVHELSTTTEVTAVWGGDATDVWVATGGGDLFRWDGATWSDVPWPNLALEGGDACAGDSAVIGIWGIGIDLFLHTGYELMHWDGRSFEVLGYWPPHAGAGDACEGGIRVVRVRGLSSTEVFAAAISGEAGERVGNGGLGGGASAVSCFTRPFVLLWDGNALHWI
jgi:hypothetical protein